MLIAFSHATQLFDWVMAGLITVNVALFVVLTFFPGIHNRLTNSIINFIKKF